MNLVARKKVLQAILEKAEENGSVDLARALSATIKSIEDELQAQDQPAVRAAREGREQARALSLGRGATAPLYGGNAGTMFSLLKDRWLSSSTDSEREEVVALSREMEHELPAGALNEFAITRASRSNEDRLTREGAALARQVQPRRTL